MNKILIGLLILGSYLFIGVVETEREDIVDRDFFVKKSPTLQFKFRNPTRCGECDFREYSMLVDESKKEFRDLCYYRYGLEDISHCEDLFRPKN